MNAIEEKMQDFLMEILSVEQGEDESSIKRLESYDEAGVLTRDAGLVVTLKNGAEFQVTIVQSRSGKGETCEYEGCWADTEDSGMGLCVDHEEQVLAEEEMSKEEAKK